MASSSREIGPKAAGDKEGGNRGREEREGRSGERECGQSISHASSIEGAKEGRGEGAKCHVIQSRLATATLSLARSLARPVGRSRSVRSRPSVINFPFASPLPAVAVRL